jgi:site-specific recombinase XerD
MKSRKAFRPGGSKKTVPLTRDQVEFILDEFRDHEDPRMEIICHLLFRCVRIGDVLRTLRIDDVYGRKGALKDKIQFTEEKTGKLRIIGIRGTGFTRALAAYWPQIASLPRTGPLFYTRKTGRPLGDSGVKRLLLRFVGKRGITQCSPHSFRKGGARHMYETGVRIENICDVLNHHSTRITEIYIDITPADIEASMRCLEI